MLTEDILRKIAGSAMINLGSGPSAYAFDYEAAGVRGMNLAMTPSAFGMELALLREYAPYFPKNCALILTVCPFSFGENRKKSDPSRYARYYAVLSRSAIDTLPAPLAHWDERVAASVDVEHPLFPYGGNIDRDEAPSAAVMAERVRAMCSCWEREFGLRDFTDAAQAEAHRNAFRRERRVLDELIAAAKELGLRPHLLLPPLHPMLRGLISPEFFEAFVLDQVRDAPAPLLDYTADPHITEDMFLGPVFLSRKGARTLTLAVWERTRGE